MARPKKTGQAAFTVTAGPQEPEASPGDPNAQTEDQLAAGADEGQKQPRARITRWNEGMRTYATLDHVAAINVDEDWIRTQYGGGKYLVYFWGTMNNGKYGYLPGKGQEFVIDDSVPFKGAMRDRGNGAAPTPKNGDVPPTGSLLDMGMLQLFKSMQDNSAMMMAQMRDNSTAQAAMLERIAAPRDNGIKDLILVLTPLLTPLIAGMVGRKDPVELATQIANLNGHGGNSVKDTMSALKDMIELREMLGPSGGDGNDGEGRWMGLLEKVIPGALDLLKTEAAKQGVAVTQLARRPVATAVTSASGPIRTATGSMERSPSQQPPSTSTPTTETTVTDAWTPFEGDMARLAQYAARAADVGDVAAGLMLMLPEERRGQLVEMLAHDDLGKTICTRFPVIAGYPKWVEDFLYELRIRFGLIDPDADADVDGDPDATLDGPVPSGEAE